MSAGESMTAAARQSGATLLPVDSEHSALFQALRAGEPREVRKMILTASGGLLGVLFGLMCGPLFRGLRSTITMMSPDLLPPIVYTLEPQIAPWSVVLSLAISLGVGIVFGVYPARQAAYMDPIEALRHE